MFVYMWEEGMEAQQSLVSLTGVSEYWGTFKWPLSFVRFEPYGW